MDPQPLPLDICQLVVEEIVREGYKKTLKSMSMISHGVSHLCRAHLFRKVVLNFGPLPAHRPEMANRTTRFIEFLHTTPHVIACIRELVLLLPDEDDCQFITLQFLSIIRSLERLHYLEVSSHDPSTRGWRSFGPEIELILSDLLRRRECRSVTIRQVALLVEGDLFASCFSNCASVTLSNVYLECTDRKVDTCVVPRTVLAFLDSLTIIQCPCLSTIVLIHPDLVSRLRRLTIVYMEQPNETERSWDLAKITHGALTDLEWRVMDDDHLGFEDKNFASVQQISLSLLPNLRSIGIGLKTNGLLQYCLSILAPAGSNNHIKLVSIIMPAICVAPATFTRQFEDWHKSRNNFARPWVQKPSRGYFESGLV